MIGAGVGLMGGAIAAPLGVEVALDEVTINGAGELVIPAGAAGDWTHEIAGDQAWLNGVYTVPIADLRLAPVVLAVAPVFGVFAVGETVGCSGGFAWPVQGEGPVSYTVRLNRGADADPLGTRVIVAEAAGPVSAEVPVEAGGGVIWASVIATDARGASAELHGDFIAIASPGFFDAFAEPEESLLGRALPGSGGVWQWSQGIGGATSSEPIVSAGSLLIQGGGNIRRYLDFGVPFDDGRLLFEVNSAQLSSGTVDALLRIQGGAYVMVSLLHSGEIKARRMNGTGVFGTYFEAPVAVQDNTWHQVEAALIGDTVSVSFDGQPVGSASNVDLAGPGLFGLGSFQGAGARVRNFEMRTS